MLLLAALLGTLSMATWCTGRAGKKVRRYLTHAACTGVVKIITIGYLQVEDTLRDPFTHVNASNVSEPIGCFTDDTDSIMTFTVHDDHLMVLGALPAVALVALVVHCISVRLKTIARKVLAAVLKLLGVLIILYTGNSLWWGDEDAWRVAGMLPLHVDTVCSQLLGVHIFWELVFSLLFGTPRLERNSRFCKVFKPRGTLQHPPLFFLNAAVCNEPLEIIERTIADLKRLAAAYPGQAIIIIHDDLLGLRPRAEQAERVALYVREGVAYTVRGPDGRGMSFAKSGNINIGLGFFIELLGHLKTRLRDGLTNNVRDVLEVLVSLQGRGSIFASLEVHIPDHVATKLADLDLAGIDRILNMQFDADTRIVGDADCLRHYALEMEPKPNRRRRRPRRRREVGLLQIATLGHAAQPNFWSLYVVFWTIFLDFVAIPTGASSGCPGPCKGHNIVLRLKDLINVAQARGRNANYGGLEIWSELTSGEDFEMWMQLVIRKMDCVYIMYTPVFEEHVTTNVHAEIGTLRKHFWSNASLMINSRAEMKRTGAIFTPELKGYLWPLHSSNSPWHAKIPTVGYLYIYFVMARKLVVEMVSVVVFDSVLPTDALKPYMLAPYDGLVTVLLLFGIFGTLALQVIKRVHITNALKNTDASAAIGYIVAPGQDGFVREVFGYGVISLLFWGGLHIDLLDVLVSYVRGIRVKFTPTHASADEIVGENLLSASARVLSSYRQRMLVLAASFAMLVVLSIFGILAPSKHVLSAILLILIPPLRLLLLDPSVLLATERTWRESLQQAQQQIQAQLQQIQAQQQQIQAFQNQSVAAVGAHQQEAQQPGPQNANNNLARARARRDRMHVFAAQQIWLAQAVMRGDDLHV